jgi:hypothetical protein
MDPVKIPQNVYIEDRIVGPLTLRQTLIMAITGGISYATYTNLLKITGGNPGILFTVACWVPFVLGTAFALVKINDLSLTRLLLLTIEKSQNPTVRTFGPRKGITITLRTADAKTIEEKNKKVLQEEMAAKQAQKKISELSAMVDTAFTKETQETPEREEAERMKTEPMTANEQSGSALPIDKNRIKVDRSDLSLPELTDLSPFRDPPSQPNRG